MYNEDNTSGQDRVEQPTQPPVMQPTEQPMPPMAPAKKKMKKPLLIGLIIAAALVVLGGGSALGYNLWYQNPDKVLADSVSKLMSRDSLSGEGAMTYDGKDGDFTLAVANKMLDGQMSVEADIKVDANGMKVNLAGNAVYDKEGVLYIKVNNAAELLDAIIEAQLAEYEGTMTPQEEAMATGMMKAMFEPVVKKLDGQWIKIAPKDLEKDDTADSEMQCVSDSIKLITSDKATRQQLTNAYKDNAFMVLTEKLGAKDGNLGFKYKLDEAKAEAFGKAVEATDIGKKIAACDKDGDKTETEDAKEDEQLTEAVTVEIWVNRWTHELASLKVVATSNEGEKINLDYTPNYDAEVTIDVPTDAITFDELGEQTGSLFKF